MCFCTVIRGLEKGSESLEWDPRSQEQVLSSRNVLGGPLSPDSGYTLVFPISGPKP